MNAFNALRGVAHRTIFAVLVIARSLAPLTPLFHLLVTDADDGCSCTGIEDGIVIDCRQWPRRFQFHVARWQDEATRRNRGRCREKPCTLFGYGKLRVVRGGWTGRCVRTGVEAMGAP